MPAGSRRLFFVGLLIFMLGGMTAYQAGRVNSGQEPAEVDLTGLSEPGVKVESSIQRYYSACGHYVYATLPAGIKDNWLPEVEVDSRFPADQGWQLKQQDGHYLITQEVEGLCSDCAPRRHLAFKDGLVAIYNGPAGSLGSLERVTNLKLESLPDFWLEKIRGGQAEFKTEQELLQALDSLDEYR